jgi:hypothetical protein
VIQRWTVLVRRLEGNCCLHLQGILEWTDT